MNFVIPLLATSLSVLLLTAGHGAETPPSSHLYPAGHDEHTLAPDPDTLPFGHALHDALPLNSLL